MVGSKLAELLVLLLALAGALLAGAASLLLGPRLCDLLGVPLASEQYPEIIRFYLTLVTVPLATLGGHRLGRWLFRATLERGGSSPVQRPVERDQRPGFLEKVGGRRLGTTMTAVASLGIGLLAAGPVIPPTVAWFDGLLRVAAVLLSALLIVLGLRTLLRVDRALRCLWLLLLTPFLQSSGWVLLLFGVATVLLLAASRFPRSPASVSSLGLERWLFLPLLVLVLTDQQARPGPLDLYHLGERVTPAAEFAAGEAPYLDVYLQHGWIENGLRTQVSFALLGVTLEAELKGYAFMIALSHAVFLLICLSAFRSWWLALPLTLALATPGFLLPDRLTGLLLTLTFLLLDLQQARGARGEPAPRRRRAPLLLAGAACGFSLFLSLETGLYAGGAGLLFLLLESPGRRERIAVRLGTFGRFGLGWLLGVFPFVMALAAQGALPAFLRNSVSQVTQQLTVWGLPFPPLSDLIDPWRSGDLSALELLGSSHLLALVTGVTLVLSLTWLLFRALAGRIGFDRGCYRLLLLTLAGALLFRSALGRSDPGHFVFAAALLWPLLVLIAQRFRRWQLLPLGLLAGWMVASHAPLYGMVQQLLRLSYPEHTAATGELCRLPLPRAGRVLIPISQARPLAFLASHLDERLPPRDAIFDFSNVAAAYFLLDRDCPTRFFVPLYAASEEQQRELIEQLDRVRPRYVLRNSPLGHPALDGRAMEERLPIVAEYLARVYAPSRRFSFGELQERR